MRVFCILKHKIEAGTPSNIGGLMGIGYCRSDSAREGNPAELVGNEEGTFDVQMGINESRNYPCPAKIGRRITGEVTVCPNCGDNSVFHSKRSRQPLSGTRVEEKGIVKQMNHSISTFLMKAARRAAPSSRSRTYKRTA